MPRLLRVLCVEDDPNDADLLIHELQSAGFAPEWTRVQTEAEYLAQLCPAPDVILSDFSLPQFSGLRALALRNERAPGIPFIIVSGTIGEEIAVEAMKHGATDYLLKDRLARLGPTITHALEESRLRHAQHEAERCIREQSEMLAHARDAIILRDIHTGRITFWNKGAEHLYGWTAAEAEGRDIRTLIFTAEKTVDAIQRQLLETGAWRGECQHHTKAGQKLTVNSNITLMRDEHGEPKSALLINLDVTEQKLLEEQLLRTQRMESIGTLASGVAHDLNNILSPILLSMPALRRKMSAEQRDGIITTIEMSARRGAEIVKQVLTFGRGMEGEKRAFRLGTVIREMAKIIRSTFPKNILLQSWPSPELWNVIGDPTQIHQVLLNLCVNARDAMPEGGTLRLGAANLNVDAGMTGEATPGPHVLLEVGDTGTGIPPEIAERIFDPFFTTKPLGTGTGLGLSTVHGIVKSHGGFIRLISQPGKGTTFQIYLPASPQSAVAIASARPGTKNTQGRGALVLVVDGEPGVRNSTRAALENHGFQVLLAADGTEALGLFARNSDKIAIALTDLTMPFMDGITLIRALRKLAPDLPIIASTGLGEKARPGELRKMGVSTILHKPYGAHLLVNAIRSRLQSLPRQAPSRHRSGTV